MPQGTIKDYDPATRSGLLLQDDRTEVHIDVSSTEGSGLRSLRIGQRGVKPPRKWGNSHDQQPANPVPERARAFRSSLLVPRGVARRQ